MRDRQWNESTGHGRSRAGGGEMNRASLQSEVRSRRLDLLAASGRGEKTTRPFRRSTVAHCQNLARFPAPDVSHCTICSSTLPSLCTSSRCASSDRAPRGQLLLTTSPRPRGALLGRLAVDTAALAPIDAHQRPRDGGFIAQNWRPPLLLFRKDLSLRPRCPAPCPAPLPAPSSRCNGVHCIASTRCLAVR